MTTYLESNISEHVGLSRDVKPMLQQKSVGSIFLETDTLDKYVWDGNKWVISENRIKEISSNDICLFLNQILKETKKTNIYLAILLDTKLENKDIT